MGVGNFLIICLCMYYTFYLVGLLSSKKRITIQQTNEKLDKLRSVPVKTMEEQKEFLQLKYPKKEKYQFKWIHFFFGIIYIVIAFTLFYGYSKLFELLKIDIPIWLAIVCIIAIPILINYILKKVNLQQSDLLVFFGKKNE
jgi:hypothetical protein